MPIYEPSTKTRAGIMRNKDLRDEDDFTKNFVLDYKPVTVVEFPNLAAAGPAGLISLGNGNPVLTTINTSDIGGLEFNADDEVYGFQTKLPYDMDPDAACGFRVKWCKVQNIAAATGGALFGITYNAVNVGVNTPMAIGVTPLNPLIVNSVDIARWVEQWTSIGEIAAGALSALVPGDDHLDCSLAMTTLDTITDATVTCVEFWYRPRVL
jgi:hypothetical protein